jgi:hypothetical protein
MVDRFTSVLLHFDGDYVNRVHQGIQFISSGKINYGSGVFGQAMYASGADYLYYNREWFLGFLNLSEYTIEYWGKAPNSEWALGCGVDDGTISGFVFRARGTVYGISYIEYGVIGDSNSTTLSNKIIANNLVGSIREFNHYAVTKQNSTYRLFFNGKLVQTRTGLSFTTPNTVFSIRGRAVRPDLTASCSIDEFRMSSKCRYSQNFEVQTKPFK